MAYTFTGENPVELGEIMKTFGTNAIDTVVIGIRDDQHDATINRVAAQPDGLIRQLVCFLSTDSILSAASS